MNGDPPDGPPHQDAQLHRPVEHAAHRVASGEPVDWPAMELDSPDSQVLEVLKGLQSIEDIAAFHRRWRNLPDPAVRETRSTWGGLTILEEIGRGSFGRVYRAHDPRLDRDVALKILECWPMSDAAHALGVVEEGRHLARLRHPNIVAIHGADRIEGAVGLEMELVAGRALSQIVAAQGPFSAGEAAVIVREVCRALAAVHRAGLVHRDVKAQNVVRERGGRIVLMDFGAGRLTDVVASAEIAGTPLYLAPEVLDGSPPSPQSDLYGVGVLLFYLVTGTFPFPAHTVDELRDAHRSGSVLRLRDLRTDLPDAIVALVTHALEIDPARRIDSAGTFEAELSRTLVDDDDHADAIAFPDSPRTWEPEASGQSLTDLVHSHGAFSADEAAIIAREVCRALTLLQAAGRDPQDVKADHVRRQRGGRIQLPAAEIRDSFHPATRSDLRDVGLLLYYLVTASDPDEVRLRLRDIRPDLPESFIRLVERAISSEIPDRGRGTAGQFARELSRAISGLEPATPARGRVRSRRMVMSIAAVVGVCASTLAILFYWPASNRAAVLTDSRVQSSSISSYPLGVNPRVVATGDFDGDGVLDLAAAASGFHSAGELRVLRGDRAGAFTTVGSYFAGRVPVCVATGDFNGDGILDVVVANSDGDVSTFGMFIGRGDLTFHPVTTSRIGMNPIDLAVADLDRDGRLDIVVSFHTGDLAILRGNGNGTFTQTVRYTLKTGPALSVAVADFNGDSAVDLGVVNRGRNELSVMIGRGDATFRLDASYAVGALPFAVAPVDLNSDGRVDLAVTNTGSGTVSVLLGAGDGRFGSPAVFPSGASSTDGPHGLAAADFDGDGLTDLAVANLAANTVATLEGNGDGTLKAPQLWPVGTGPYSIVVADFNGDGSPDFAAPEMTAGSLSLVLLTRRDARMPTVSITTPSSAVYSLNQIVSADYSCNGGASRAATCLGTVPNGASIHTNAVGPQSFTVTAADAGGRKARQGRTYTVAYNTCPLFDQAKAHRSGGAIAIKLQLCDVNNANTSKPLTNVTAITVYGLSNERWAPLVASGRANLGGRFSYSSGHYTFNLSLKGYLPGAYAMVFTAGSDPTAHTVNFTVK